MTKMVVLAILGYIGPVHPSKIEKFKILTFSSEIENVKRATHKAPIFAGILKVRIETFKRD